MIQERAFQGHSEKKLWSLCRQLRTVRSQVQLLQHEAHERSLANEQLAELHSQTQQQLTEAEADKAALLDYVQASRETALLS